MSADPCHHIVPLAPVGAEALREVSELLRGSGSLGDPASGPCWRARVHRDDALALSRESCLAVHHRKRRHYCHLFYHLNCHLLTHTQRHLPGRADFVVLRRRGRKVSRGEHCANKGQAVFFPTWTDGAALPAAIVTLENARQLRISRFSVLRLSCSAHPEPNTGRPGQRPDQGCGHRLHAVTCEKFIKDIGKLFYYLKATYLPLAYRMAIH